MVLLKMIKSILETLTLQLAPAIKEVAIKEDQTSAYLKKHNLIFAFRGSDYHHFNVIDLTIPIVVDKITPRSKAKGNILTIHSDYSEVVVFEQEKEWEGGGMMFAHVIWTENDEIVILSFNKFATKTELSLQSKKVAFDEIRKRTDAFEQSIACKYQKSKQVSSDEEESSKENDERQSSSIAEIRDDETERKSCETLGNRYHIVTANLFHY